MTADLLQQAVDAWHRADDRAAEAERQLRAASDAVIAQGKAVPLELIAQARRARSDANARLREAIALAQALRHPVPQRRTPDAPPASGPGSLD